MILIGLSGSQFYKKTHPFAREREEWRERGKGREKGDGSEGRGEWFNLRTVFNNSKDLIVETTKLADK